MDKNIFLRHQTLNTIIDSSPTTGVFQVLLNNIHTNFKKTVSPKNVWMQHWLSSMDNDEKVFH